MLQKCVFDFSGQNRTELSREKIVIFGRPGGYEHPPPPGPILATGPPRSCGAPRVSRVRPCDMSHSRVTYRALAWLSGLSGMSAWGVRPAGGHQGRPPVSSVLEGAIRDCSKVVRELKKFRADFGTNMKKIGRKICVSPSAKRRNFLSRARSHEKICVCGRKNFGNFVHGGFVHFRGRGSGGAKMTCDLEHLGNSRNRERKSGKKFSRSARKILDPREKILDPREKILQILEILEILETFGNF